MKRSMVTGFLDASWKVGRLFDIPIKLHITLLFFLLPAFRIAPDLGPVLALEFVFLIVLSILLHELGHALMAKHYRLRGLSITLHGFGGFAMSSGARTPRQSLAITMAGPAVTFAIGILCCAIGRLDTGLQFHIIYSLGLINLWLGVMNLIPCLPFDGGMALVAILNMRHTEFKAQRIVGHIGLLITPPLFIAAMLLKLPYASLFAIMGAISSYMILAGTGGVRFAELLEDRRKRKEEAAYRAKKEAQSQEYLGNVFDRQKEREERERLRKLFEDSSKD